MFSYEKEKVSVGKAAYDILSRPQEEMQVQEILDEYAEEYVKEMEATVQANFNKFESPFYIVVLHKKEPWAMNVLRNWFVARQTAPTMKHMWEQYPNHSHTLYEVHKEGMIKIVHSLPTRQEAQVVLNNASLYDEKLVKWCSQALSM